VTRASGAAARLELPKSQADRLILSVVRPHQCPLVLAGACLRVCGVESGTMSARAFIKAHADRAHARRVLARHLFWLKDIHA
jgi:hypothetical protein